MKLTLMHRPRGTRVGLALLGLLGACQNVPPSGHVADLKVTATWGTDHNVVVSVSNVGTAAATPVVLEIHAPFGLSGLGYLSNVPAPWACEWLPDGPPPMNDLGWYRCTADSVAAGSSLANIQFANTRDTAMTISVAAANGESELANNSLYLYPPSTTTSQPPGSTTTIVASTTTTLFGESSSAWSSVSSSASSSASNSSSRPPSTQTSQTSQPPSTALVQPDLLIAYGWPADDITVVVNEVGGVDVSPVVLDISGPHIYSLNVVPAPWSCTVVEPVSPLNGYIGRFRCTAPSIDAWSVLPAIQFRGLYNGGFTATIAPASGETKLNNNSVTATAPSATTTSIP